MHFLEWKLPIIGKLCCKLWTKYRRHQIIGQLQHYRARRIVSWHVISHFQMLRDQHSLLAEADILTKIIERYQTWNTSAERKLHALEIQFPQTVKHALLRMAEHSCLRKERLLEAEFHEKRLISPKVYRALDKKLCSKVAQNLES